jgi:hypothetical protein
MGYTAAPEKLWPGEAECAFLPWAWIHEADKRRLTTEPHECADCGMADLPWVPAWQLCRYCNDLRALRRADR